MKKKNGLQEVGEKENLKICYAFFIVKKIISKVKCEVIFIIGFNELTPFT